MTASLDVGVAYEAAMQIFNIVWAIGDGMMLAFLIVFFAMAVTSAVYIKVAEG